MNGEILNTEIELENQIVKLIPFDNPRNQELKEIIFDDYAWKYMGMFIKTEKDFDNYIANTLEAQKNLCITYLNNSGLIPKMI